MEDRALASVEAYDPETDVWRALEPVSTPRHGVQAAVCGGAVYLAAGGQTPGDAEPTDAHEVYVPADDSGCHTDVEWRLTGEAFSASRVSISPFRGRPRSSSAPTGGSTSRSRTDC